MFIKLFTKSMRQLEQSLDVRSQRHAVITSNIVNQDTPGYKAKKIDFKKVLETVSNSSNSLRLDQTSPTHIPSPSQQSQLSPEVTLSGTRGSNRLDGNTVKVEKEMTHLAENTFMYQATAQLIASKFQGLKNAINEGR